MGKPTRQTHYPRCAVRFPTCDYCGRTWTKRAQGGWTPPYCPSEACRKAHNAKRMRELNARHASAGQSLWSKRYEANREQRNAERNAYNQTERGAELRKAAWQRRRAVKKSSGWADAVLARAVYERDGWTCGICAEPVDPEVAYPDPMSASLDHIVPLSLGGEHTEANTRCSHLTCNVRRGNRVA